MKHTDVISIRGYWIDLDGKYPIYIDKNIYSNLSFMSVEIKDLYINKDWDYDTRTLIRHMRDIKDIFMGIKYNVVVNPNRRSVACKDGCQDPYYIFTKECEYVNIIDTKVLDPNPITVFIDTVIGLGVEPKIEEAKAVLAEASFNVSYIEEEDEHFLLPYVKAVYIPFKPLEYPQD